MNSKKTKFTLGIITVVIVLFSILSYNVLSSFKEVTFNKTEEIIEQQKRWIDQSINLSDTIPIKIRNQRDSVIRAELTFLKTNDSLLKLNKKREPVIN